MRFAISKPKFGLCKIESICVCTDCPLSFLLYFVCRWPTHPPWTVSMAQAALWDITPQTRIPTLLIVFCVHVLLLVGRCEFRPNSWEMAGRRLPWPSIMQPQAIPGCLNAPENNPCPCRSSKSYTQRRGSEAAAIGGQLGCVRRSVMQSLVDVTGRTWASPKGTTGAKRPRTTPASDSEVP